MVYILIALLGYILGCSNMAYYISRLKKIDFRAGGSGNLGASNAMILAGWKAGILVALHDIGKATAAALLAEILFPTVSLAGAVAGVGAVFGHMFPFYLKFRGGKGFASYFGVALALNWRFALLLALALILITLISDYIVFSTMTAVVATPVYAAVTTGFPCALVLLCASAIIIWKHRENFVRLRNGTEIGLRRANRSAKERVK